MAEIRLADEAPGERPESLREVLKGQPPHSLHHRGMLYQRPSFSGDDRVFFDLVAYAPGMNTQQADILAVLEAEAAPRRRIATGTISTGARKLIDRARGR